MRLPGVFVHAALAEQPPFAVAHSFTSVLQVVPVQPEGQLQVYVPGPVELQVPPFWHGLVGLQALTGVSQFTPCQPDAQAQVYEPPEPLVQLPLTQGLLAQPMTTVSQFVPVKPAGHEQE